MIYVRESIMQVLGTIDGMTVQGMVSQYSENLKAGLYRAALGPIIRP